MTAFVVYNGWIAVEQTKVGHHDNRMGVCSNGTNNEQFHTMFSTNTLRLYPFRGASDVQQNQ